MSAASRPCRMLFCNTKAARVSPKTETEVIPANLASHCSSTAWRRGIERKGVTLCLLQVEIKLRLPNQEAHDKLEAALKPELQATHQQENIFFDGADKELSQQKVVVRCRFYNTDQRCLLTIKVGPSALDSYLAASQLNARAYQDISLLAVVIRVEGDIANDMCALNLLDLGQSFDDDQWYKQVLASTHDWHTNCLYASLFQSQRQMLRNSVSGICNFTYRGQFRTQNFTGATSPERWNWTRHRGWGGYRP